MTNYRNIFDLKNTTSYILGGLGLIGLESSIALSLCGSKVIVLDKNIKGKEIIKKINQKHKINIIFEYLDISNLKILEKKYLNLINKYSIPDIFINASYPKNNNWNQNSFSKINLQILEENIHTHLNTYSWIAKLVADSMIEQKLGSIIQLGSIYGFVGQDLNLYKNLDANENMTYSIIKGGIINLTRQMASYYGQYNIRVNCISPGAIKNFDKKDLTNNNVFRSRYIKKTPLKRLGQPSDVASSVVFLSSKASNYITGINLVIDGGMTII